MILKKAEEPTTRLEAVSSAVELDNDRFDIGTNKIEKRRESQHRTSSTNLFKSKIVVLRESGKTQNEILELFSGIALSKVSKWIKTPAKIMKSAAEDHKTC